MILSCAAMRAVEGRAFADGISAGDLMEEAGALIAQQVALTFPQPGRCLAVFGKGHNGGDALVAARHLAARGWEVCLIGACDEESWGDLTRQNFAPLSGCERGDVNCIPHARGNPLVILDGLLGIGSNGDLRGNLSTCTQAINALRAKSAAHVFALDLPTGLNGDTGATDPHCVVADTTLAIGFAKAGLVTDNAMNYVGRLRVLGLQALTKRAGSASLGATVVTPAQLRGVLPRRRHDSHKGDYGRVGIIAGSRGMLGAAALCASGCVKAGAGLVTLYATADLVDRLSVMVPLEVMVQTVAAFTEAADASHDSWAIGPGLGQGHTAEVAALTRHLPQPVVLDADGLNSIAAKPEVLNQAAGARIVTPHPGEIARLAPDLAGHPRAEIARMFVHRFPKTTLLLKGGRSIIAQAEEPLAYNSTGTAGMATGGMGDVLTGVVAALAGQGLRGFHAAQAGAWLCGRAGELAIDLGGETEETLTPTRLLDFLAAAMREWRSGECC